MLKVLAFEFLVFTFFFFLKHLKLNQASKQICFWLEFFSHTYSILLKSSFSTTLHLTWQARNVIKITFDVRISPSWNLCYCWNPTPNKLQQRGASKVKNWRVCVITWWADFDIFNREKCVDLQICSSIRDYPYIT